MRICLYARCSKDDGTQDPDNQLKPLRDFATALQGKVVEEYIDLASGGGSADRVNFLRMLDDADKHKFDLILVWALDRLSREGISNTFSYLDRLKRAGVALKSLQESWLDTRAEGVGQLLVSVFAWVAQQERARIVERVRAGLARAKRSGKHLGRPSGAKDRKERRKSGYLLRYTKHKRQGNG